MKYLITHIIAFNCLFFIPKQSYAQFAGGTADGHANLRLSNTVCVVTNVNPFTGGTADGHANLRLSNVVCSIISVNPFAGGQADGHARIQLTNVSLLECLGVELPIKLLSFNADCNNGSVKIRWTTVSEINNDYFTIEHSNDAITFEKVAIIQGAGNSNNAINYLFNDEEPLSGISYYRLKQTDYNGNFEYSSIVSVNCNDEVMESVKVYPNPVLDELTLEIEENNEPILFEIINPLGIVVNEGTLTTKLTLSMKDYAAGIYLLRFTNLPSSRTNGKTLKNKKIVKL